MLTFFPQTHPNSSAVLWQSHRSCLGVCLFSAATWDVRSNRDPFVQRGLSTWAVLGRGEATGKSDAFHLPGMSSASGSGDSFGQRIHRFVLVGAFGSCFLANPPSLKCTSEKGAFSSPKKTGLFWNLSQEPCSATSPASQDLEQLNPPNPLNVRGATTADDFLPKPDY